MNQQQLQTVTTLHAKWQENPVQATLLARLNYRVIDQEMVSYVGGLAQSAMAGAQITEQLNVWAQGMGMAPGTGFGAAGGAHGLSGFYEMIRAVFQYQGDPPVSRELSARALDILQGRLPPITGLQLAGSDVPFLGDQLRAYLGIFQMMDPGMESVFALPGLLAAAMALPRQQLRALFGQPESDSRESFLAVMEQVRQLDDSQGEQAEKLLLKALGLAAESPEAEDDIEALQQILLLTRHAKLKLNTIRRCVEQVCALIENGFRGNSLGQIVGILGPMVAANELSDELDQSLAEAGTALLEGGLDRQVRLLLAVAVAQGWLRVGRSDNADQTLRKVKKLNLNATDSLQVAQAEADICWESGDREGAADLLVAALERKGKQDPAVRQMALQKLISVWPERRDGIDKWLGEYSSKLEAMEEPTRTVLRISLLTALVKAGQPARALEIGNAIDFDRLREDLPDDFASWVDQIESQVVPMLASLGGGPG